MKNCKACGDDSLIKNGRTQQGVQRYKCKSCLGTFREGDKRLKHSMEKRIKVIKMYLEGIGIRSIERLEGVSSPLIIYWIRNFSDLIRKDISSANIPDDVRDIEIIEIDKLSSNCKKDEIEFTYGLLFTETGIKLLTPK